jgi:hypothetical protein
MDSYVKSIIYVAKKRKVPYGQVIEDVLDRALFNNNEKIKQKMLENKEIQNIVQNIKTRLSEKIQQIFPRAVLKDSF